MDTSFRRVLQGRRVVINLRSGSAIEGVLVRRAGPLYCLRNAILHDPTAAGPAPMDGEAIVDRTQVDFIQAF